MTRKRLSSEEWKNFKAEKLAKWVKPVRLEDYEEADLKYKEFIENKKTEANYLHKLGIETERWIIEEGEKRKAGFRAQKWFSELLFDIEVTHWPELKRNSFMTIQEWLLLLDKMLKIMPNEETVKRWKAIKNKVEIGFDIEIPKFGPIEVKAVPHNEDYVNIKKLAWDSKPSSYLVVIKQCDEAMETFQFIGWLYGHEVFQLPVETILTKLLGRPEFYVCNLRKLKKPENFIKKLLKISRKNPK